MLQICIAALRLIEVLSVEDLKELLPLLNKHGEQLSTSLDRYYTARSDQSTLGVCNSNTFIIRLPLGVKKIGLNSNGGLTIEVKYAVELGKYEYAVLKSRWY